VDSGLLGGAQRKARPGRSPAGRPGRVAGPGRGGRRGRRGPAVPRSTRKGRRSGAPGRGVVSCWSAASTSAGGRPVVCSPALGRICSSTARASASDKTRVASASSRAFARSIRPSWWARAVPGSRISKSRASAVQVPAAWLVKVSAAAISSTANSLICSGNCPETGGGTPGAGRRRASSVTAARPQALAQDSIRCQARSTPTSSSSSRSASPSSRVTAPANPASVPLGAQVSRAPPDSNPQPDCRGMSGTRGRNPAARLSPAAAIARSWRAASIPANSSPIGTSANSGGQPVSGPRDHPGCNASGRGSSSPTGLGNGAPP
jgi:hypothetical protein